MLNVENCENGYRSEWGAALCTLHPRCSDGCEDWRPMVTEERAEYVTPRPTWETWQQADDALAEKDKRIALLERRIFDLQTQLEDANRRCVTCAARKDGAA